MHIVTRLKANNKLQIKRYRIADGYGRAPNKDDPPEVADILYSGLQLQKIENFNKIVSHHSTIKVNKYESSFGSQLNIFGEKEDSPCLFSEVTAQSCVLPEKIDLFYESERGEDGRIVHASYWELVQQRNVALDLLKKSQYNSKKPRPWGSQTKLKEFRYQAGEKIKEGGAIIDRFCKVENSTMITLTLPGNNWIAFDALARWSGWVVNRLCQMIRNRTRRLPDPYWFFVWEHQKRGALHMHWCLGWEVEQSIREDLAYRLKDLWFKLLEEISVKENIDLFAQKGFNRTHRGNPRIWKWDIQQIHTSVASYFAKYCAKNTRLSQSESDTSSGRTGDAPPASRERTLSPNRTCPSRYWGSSSTIKRWSRRLGVEHKFSVDSPESCDAMLCRIRGLLPVNQCYRKIISVPFEVFEPSTGICLASGETETYVVAPELYPA